MIVRKDIFRPGKYRLPDGREFEFTANDVQRAHANGVAMLRNRFAVPTIYEHDLTAKPAMLSDSASKPDWPESFARKAIGHVTSFGLRREEGVPVLWTEHEIPDEQDVQQWRKARFASPCLDRNVTDSKGNRYPGLSVLHVAVTPRPIQVEQLPIQLSTTHYGSPICLSMEYLEMADENDDKKSGNGSRNNSKGGDSGGGEFTRIRDALSTMGHTLPDSVTDWSGLATALEVLAANGGAGGGDDPGDDFGGDGTGSETTTSNPPVMMSAQQRKAEERLVAVERRSLATRAESATRTLVSRGLMTSDQAKKFVGRFGAINLSFTESGEVAKNDVLAQLESYEQIASNAKRQKGQTIDLSNTVSMGQPQINQRDPKLTEERQKAAAEMISSMTSIAKK
jgi:hypothetical protein